MPGGIMRDCFMSNCGVGIHIGVPAGLQTAPEPT
jgi:hypothetical protein